MLDREWVTTAAQLAALTPARRRRVIEEQIATLRHHLASARAAYHEQREQLSPEEAAQVRKLMSVGTRLLNHFLTLRAEQRSASRHT